VTLVILAAAGAIAVPALVAWRPLGARDAAVGELVRVIALARNRAVVSGAATELVMDAASAQIWLSPRDTSFVLALPDGCRLRGASRSRLHFDAAGPAHGDAPVVVCGLDSARISVDALTGEARAGWAR
jgi:hypothetical protein